MSNKAVKCRFYTKKMVGFMKPSFAGTMQALV